MRNIRFAEGLHVVPVLAPIDLVANDAGTEFIDMQLFHHVTFMLQFGAMTSDSTDTATVTVEACPIGTTTDGGETAIPFSYRLSSAVATDSMGAITATTDTGIAITAEDDNKLLIIDVDAEQVAAAVAGGRYVRAFITTNAEMASCIVGGVAVLEPRYPQNTNLSSS